MFKNYPLSLYKRKQIQSTHDIRKSFLDYFSENNHIVLPSSNLVPPLDDQTLHFTTAGMVQFKDYFTGIRSPPHHSIATVQKCMRAGGKHNDLDNVGYTNRHQTFFEMLGNFSFDGYFKREAINHSWNFLTKELQLPKDRLIVSVLHGDQETYDIWLKDFNIPKSRIIECGEEDNFWSMGQVGPCGPCTEIFWDKLENIDGERYLEIWNLVFMEFESSIDGSLTPLKAKCIDTGMGLERLASVLQGKRSNYETDDLRFICESVRQLAEIKSGTRFNYTPKNEVAIRVIADHLRSCSMLVCEGLVPGNQGRSYVLRRILRRAARYGHQIGLSQPFMADLYPCIVATLGQAYPELIEREEYIKNVLTQEELLFSSSLNKALDYVEHIFTSSKLSDTNTFPIFEAYKLHNTYGLPLDLVDIVARERGWTVDINGLNEFIKEKSLKDKETWKGVAKDTVPVDIKSWNITPQFIGYEKLESDESSVVAAFQYSKDKMWISINPCPFYAESGGQVGDKGTLIYNGQKFDVIDVKSPYDGGIALKIEIKPEQHDLTPSIGSIVKAQVNHELRKDTMKSHTATHLLHSALISILGNHVKQSGSRVEPNRLRFDFVHYDTLTNAQIDEIETWVNNAIFDAVNVTTTVTTYEEAMNMKAISLFQEKYNKESIRIVDAHGLSTEFCGGTHVDNTIQIGAFKIVSQSGVSNGIRRIEAVTGKLAVNWLRERSQVVEKISDVLKVSDAMNLSKKIDEIIQSRKSLKKDLENTKKQLLDLQEQSISDLPITPQSFDVEKYETVETKTTVTTTTYRKSQGFYSGKALTIHQFDIDDVKLLRERSDKFRLEDPSSIHCLISKDTIIVTSSETTITEILKDVLNKLGGKGGGKKNFLEGRLVCKLNELPKKLEMLLGE